SSSLLPCQTLSGTWIGTPVTYLRMRKNGVFRLRLCLGARLLAHCHGAFPRPLTGSRIGVGPLTTHRQAPPVPEPAIRADLHQTLDVERNFLPEVAFDPILFLDQFPDLVRFVVVEIPHLALGTDARIRQNPGRQ